MDAELTCPSCGADVGYDDVEVAESDAECRCPVCGTETPTDEWFS